MKQKKKEGKQQKKEKLTKDTFQAPLAPTAIIADIIIEYEIENVLEKIAIAEDLQSKKAQNLGL